MFCKELDFVYYRLFHAAGEAHAGEAHAGEAALLHDSVIPPL